MVVEKTKVNMCEIFIVRLLDKIAKLKKSKNAIFRFESFLKNLFFYATKKIYGMKNWDSNECSMKMVT